MNTYVFTGTYTQKNKTEHRNEGIYTYRFDDANGILTLSASSHAGLNPGFVRLHPNKKFLYTVNELTEGGVSALSVEPETGAVQLINSQPSQGMHPCYLSIDPSGKYALVANYSSGSLVVFPIQPDGSLKPASSFVEHAGSGPHKRRQEGPHAHSIGFDLSGKHVLAADLGLDRLFVYDLDVKTGSLALGALWGAAMRPGAGPRHFACHPNGKVIYVANEVDSTVTACHWDPETGSLTPFQNLPTLPEHFSGDNTVADIHLTPDARTLVVSNRGDNSLAIYRVGENGGLERIGIVGCGGNWPRNFAISPSGKWLLCANQYSDSISVFRLDPSTGMPKATGDIISVPSPVCLEFAVL